jgi:transcriptional regulator GlxA family with amidase domain
MARSAGLGVSAFVRAFRGSTGVTPAAFALKLRLDHAAQMLRSTDLGAREIAALSGFASAAHLVRTFRVHRGITPGRWRREAAQQKRELVSQNPRKDGPIEIGDTLERS